MLRNGLTELQDISSAGVGDKCLMDTLIPAIEGYEQAVRRGDSFSESLEQLKRAAVAGRDSTRDLVAKIGRASRLGNVRAACWMPVRYPVAYFYANWPMR
ncbi:dihydroxyacetone kinase [Serratia fonticola]|uniref:Dihydroxyacetone kinase n=1 Tax=Serratia fonticola TaxID=47917 RepID=A0A4U9WCT1_SERFO|nr:dihydroxyacetone kinase [Serratia fonticola]